MLKKSTIWFLMIYILFGSVCLKAEPAQEPVTLKLFQMPDPKNTTAFNQADLAVVRAFQKKYPYINLKRFSGIQIQGMGMDSGPLLAIAGGTSPDVIYVNFRQSDTYIQQGFLYPMDEYMEDISEELQNLRVAKPVWPVIKRQGPDNKKHVYALPYNLYIRALCYRKDLFAKVGLDPEQPPKDWKEFYEYAQKLTVPENKTYGLFMASGPSAAWDFMCYLWSAGGDAVVQDENGQWQAVFDSDEAVEALLFYLKLITPKWTDSEGRTHEGYVLRSGIDNTAWSEGRLGMRMQYLDEKSIGRGIDPSILGIAPVPLGPTGLRGSELNCTMMGIFAGQKDKRVRDAAWKYIWFYDSEEARKIRMQVMIENGYGKLMNPVYLKRYGYEEYLEEVPKTWLPVFEEALTNGKPEPYGKNCQMVYQFMTKPIDQAIARAYRGTLGATDDEKRKELKKILITAAARTNKEMIGNISDEEQGFRKKIAFIVVVIGACIFCFVLYRVWNIFTPKGEGIPKGWGFRKNYIAYLIMLPAIASIAIWMYGPMLMGSKMAFQDYQLVKESSWIGLGNFADVLFDATWWQSIWHTFYYMILMLGLGFWPPILLAILLQEVSHGKVFYRTVYYLPAVISGFVVIYLWRLFYDPSSIGVLNQILAVFGLEPLRWIQDERLAMVCCVIPTIWAGMGPGCLIYLAALKGIPDELYEAADVDGTSFFEKIRYITIPNLKALIIINFIGAFIAAAQNSGMILVMTFGGPNDATKVAGLHIFEKAYLYLKFGTATTMAWILGITLLGFTVNQLKMLSNLEFRAAGTMKK